MLKFLFTAARAAELTYKILATSVLIGCLAVEVTKNAKRKKLREL